MRLFRPEALRSQDTLHGEVSLVPPVSWQLLGAFLLAVVVVAGVFASLAGYAKVTTVRGQVEGAKGLIRLAPARAGVFDQVLVHEGQSVRAGTVLAHVALETLSRDGSLQARREAALAQQRLALGDRLRTLEAGGRGRVEMLEAQIAGDTRQISALREQISEQEPLIRTAQEDLREIQPLNEQGLISNRDFRLREEQLAQRRQALSRLRQEIGARSSAIDVARAEIARTRADTEGQASQVAAVRAELDRSGAGDDLLRGVDLRAPVDGVVTAVLAHAGDAATPGAAAMSLVPAGDRPEAVLSAPASAVGLVEPGQKVRIAVDAFPFQTFGALEGVVTSVTRATAPADLAAGAPARFVIRATLPGEVLAYGAPRPLRPGMTLTARIRTRPRSLLAWLFDPFLAVARR